MNTILSINSGILGSLFSGAIDQAKQCIMSHPTTQKIALGTGLILTGGAGLMRSGIGNLIPDYFSNRKVAPINYTLAGASTLAIGAGVFMIYSGITDFYPEEPSSDNQLTAPSTETPETSDSSLSPAISQPLEKNQTFKPPVSNNMCETEPEICKYNLGIPRAQMPQVEGEASDSFLNYFQEKQISVVRNTPMPATSFFSTQSELNTEKVTGMINSAVQGKFDPCQKEIMVSSYDQHVVDGHHRWAACRQLGRNVTIASIHAPIEFILNVAGSFPGITRQSLNHFSNR